MTLQPFRTFAADQRGTKVPATFASISSFSYTFWVRLAALVAGRIIRVGDPMDPASFAVDIRVATAAEEVFTQTNCFILTRRHRTATSLGSADRTASPTGSAVADTWLHLIASFPSGAHPQLYINGRAVAMTAPDTALSGAPRVTSTDELAIGDPTTDARPGFIGDNSRVTLFPFAMPATRAMITYRHQSEPLSWVGIGSKDALAATNHSPVAVPLQATANSGVPKTIDPRPVGFDQDGDTASIVPGSATASPGSVVISSGALVYTPPASFVGSGRLGYSLRDTSGLTSVGRVDVAVTSAPTTGLPLRPIPTTTNNVTLTAGGNLGQKLRDAYLAANPSTTIWYDPAGDYTPPSPATTWEFNRAPSGLSAANPIVIRPIGDVWGVARLMARLNFGAPDTIIAGFAMSPSIAGRIVEMRGDRSRVTRFDINYQGTNAAVGIVVFEGADDAIVDRCNIRIWKGGAGSGDGRGIGYDGPTSGLTSAAFPKRVITELNYLYGGNGRQGEANVNFHEAIQTGRGVGTGEIDLAALVHFNLIDNWSNDSEPIGVKSRNGRYRNNILRNSGSGPKLSNRLGNGNTWEACRAESGGFIIGDKDTRLIGCVVTDPQGNIHIKAGNISDAAYAASTAGNNQVAATDTILDWCEGVVLVGPVTVNSSGNPVDTAPALRTTIRSHGNPNQIKSLPRGSSNGSQFFWDTLNVGGGAPGSKPAIVNLTPANTGLNAP